MDQPERGKIYGEWKFEKQIGSGAFGIVTRWKRVKTDEQLVVKQCSSELSTSNRKRWKDEINLLKKHRHKNLVEGRDVPKEIAKVLNSPEILLGMESCECDLREVLGYIANCCGLIESMVLKILDDVACGLNFLHESNIIHRDLKPENILKSCNGNQILYKIADLGLAKDLDRSMCKTVVGTKEYMAPELIESQKGYTKAADYWSFGTVIFECISGIRPFQLIYKTTFLKHQQISRNKTDNDIWGSDTLDGVKFYSELSLPNWLCKALTKPLKEWLQLVLQHDAEKRETAKCFSMISDILNISEIHLFDIMTCQESAYVLKPGDTVKNLKEFIQQEFNIEINDQYLVKAGSDILIDQDLLEKSAEIVYIFRVNLNAKYKLNKDMPDRVKELLGNCEEKQKHDELLLKWSHCLYYCDKQSNNYDRLLKGQNALLKILKDRMDTIDELKDKVNNLIIQIKAKVDFFNKSLDNDIQFYEATATTLKEEWLKAQVDINTFKDDTLNVNSLMNDVSILKNELMKFLSASNNQFPNEFEITKKKAETEIQNLKKSKNSENMHDSSEMFRIIWKLHLNEGPFKDFYIQLRKIMAIKEKIKKTILDLNAKIQDFNNFEMSIEETQRCRQAEIMKLKNKGSCVSLNDELGNAVMNELMKELSKVDEFSCSDIISEIDEKFFRLESLFMEENGGPRTNDHMKPLFTGRRPVSQTCSLELQKSRPPLSFESEYLYGDFSIPRRYSAPSNISSIKEIRGNMPSIIETTTETSEKQTENRKCCNEYFYKSNQHDNDTYEKNFFPRSYQDFKGESSLFTEISSQHYTNNFDFSQNSYQPNIDYPSVDFSQTSYELESQREPILSTVIMSREL